MSLTAFILIPVLAGFILYIMWGVIEDEDVIGALTAFFIAIFIVWYAVFGLIVSDNRGVRQWYAPINNVHIDSVTGNVILTVSDSIFFSDNSLVSKHSKEGDSIRIERRTSLYKQDFSDYYYEGVKIKIVSPE